MDEKNYKAYARCENCGTDSLHEIPKGTAIKEYMNQAICPHCGCKTLVKSAKSVTRARQY